MTSVSLAAIFWCILIPSFETSKQFVANGCYCVCPPYQNLSGMIFWKQLFQDDCNCLYTVEPMPVPRHDVEAYCLLCDCKFVERKNTATKIILIVSLSVFGAILLFKVLSVVVKHFNHKPDAYTKPLHNEEDPHA
ncbi:proton-transporting V-type ATPase complex assembly regulator TMEM9-like [Ahaetulla prasina]|uniref:proton-transporting V-type ATPase complex assembly regulator TMEM9-like n=1 Tax=Ahaetulla prasina TaxID=499056 RepID=UPI002649C27C|nr:proton-transporting V-type ATPase complex assembly regulator TMEM9-like [Ahaetulla prasina]XP_058034429.1 proton-transporting V-type ATPase complex assembly regulator TMEM9-like [Ahaetulla prasina]XP_058034430.1 proton-transporting V-type ATPase complex assembly regulator TMEM9-like [Ahaetulla prasina]XP_058034431.1 proton-transporting V-type ATPase complex assembly regulator TMEM9-like [Ahaetulla prasina]XP_058034432.1 proton-transporting V-type ATPase complex assembly regulator TMEM9-like 